MYVAHTCYCLIHVARCSVNSVSYNDQVSLTRLLGWQQWKSQWKTKTTSKQPALFMNQLEGASPSGESNDNRN